MKLISCVIPLFAIFLITSCSPSDKYKTEITEIDSCLSEVDRIEADLNGIEFDSLRLMVQHVLMNEDTIEKYYNPDTISMEIGKRMIECKGIRKMLKNVDTKEKGYKDEIAAIRVQFENLKSDIENGIMEEEQIKSAIEKEKIGLNYLNVSFGDFYILQELEKKYYYSAVPIIDELIVKIKNEAQLEE